MTVASSPIAQRGFDTAEFARRCAAAQAVMATQNLGGDTIGLRSGNQIFHWIYDPVLAKPDPAMVCRLARHRRAGCGYPDHWGAFDARMLCV